MVGALRDLDLTVIVAARDAAKAQAMAAPLGASGIGWEEIPETEHQVLVNTTPLGQADSGESPIPDDWIRPGSLVLDAVYRPMKTPLLAAANRQGCVCVPGGEWFVRQAAAQFKLFTRSDPDDALMRAAFEGALGLG